MSVKEITAEERAAAAEAKANALEAQFKAIAAGRREDVITKHRDRIAPSALESVRSYGEFCGDDIAKFEKFVETLQPVTRTDRTSVIPDPTTVESVLSGLASITSTVPGVGGEAGAKQVAKWLGTSVEKLDRYADVTGYRSDGTFEMKDGSVLTRDELKKKLAA